jgi:serine/threonine protein kinase
MATVYKAHDTNLDRVVAVKVLHDHLADDPDFQARFEREAKLVAALNHPNIVQVFDYDEIERLDGAGKTQKIYLMVMPFISGPTLRSVLEDRQTLGEPLSLEQIGVVIESVCKALSYAHKQGMVHRDVTPSNILYAEGVDQDRVLLADFGLARLAFGTRITQTGMTTGTPVYMSPEQGMGEAPDSRSDLYSLGVILYEILSGHPPFSGETAYSLIMKHVTEPVAIEPLKLKGVSNAMIAVVQRVLAKSPKDRYQDADTFLADFKKALVNELPTAVRSGLGTVVLPSVPAPATPSPSPQPRFSPRTAIFLLGGVIVGLVAASLILSVRPATAPVGGRAMVTLAVLPTSKNRMGSSMTDAAVQFTDDFSSKTRRAAWVMESEDALVSRKIIEGSALRVTSQLPSTAFTTVVNPRSASYSGAITIEAKLKLSEKSQPPTATGVVFRYQSEDEYYVFAIDGSRRWSIWLRKSGQWTELREVSSGELWTTSEVIKPLGEENTIKLTIETETIRAQVNGVDLITLTGVKPDIKYGGVGIYLATTTNQMETAPFAEVDLTYYSVQRYTPQATPVIPSPVAVTK